MKQEVFLYTTQGIMKMNMKLVQNMLSFTLLNVGRIKKRNTIAHVGKQVL